MIITTNISGVYVFNQNYKLVAKKIFTLEQAKKYNKDLEEGRWLSPEKDFIKKYKNSTFIGFKKERLGDIKLSHDLKKLDAVSKYFEKNALDIIRKNNTALTKDAIRASVNTDQFVIQTINSISETQKVCNILAKRLREWYELHCPEFSKSISSHQKFAELIQKKSKDELLKEIKAQDTMGADLSKEDLAPIRKLAKELTEIYKFLEDQESYLKMTMEKLCPNLLAITGPLIGAKLIEAAGSLQKLVNFPAGTIQLLGAEKALFRHLKTGARSPKYGLLFDHPFILGAKEKDRGKIARHLANKISLAVRIDFYEGKFIGDKLKADLEKFMKNLKSQKVKK
ncbi:NOP58 family protein [Candidatus Woesearchaeota archaeon]|nr:NOP58 family protein [Candidatus Woesearchaeota archaeon]MBW3014568.1 NOP58 family protein [Candidatus Woesearchaeota archaeon]